MRKHFSYANVAATLALVFAMSGGALAASHYLITSTKQIKPNVIKALRGQQGPPGPPGSQVIPAWLFNEVEALKQKVWNLETQTQHLGPELTETKEAGDAICDGLSEAESQASNKAILEPSRWGAIDETLKAMKSAEGSTGFCAWFER